MYRLVQQINKEKTVSVEYLKRAISDAKERRMQAMSRLYDLCLINSISPNGMSEEDEQDIQQYLFNYFKEDMKLLADNYDKIDILNYDKEYVENNVKDTEFLSLIDSYYNYSKASNDISIMEKMMERKQPGKTEISASKMGGIKGNINYQYEFIPEMFCNSNTQYIQEVHIGRSLIHTVIKNLGISEADYRAHYLSSESFFTNELTQLEEEENITRVLQGKYELNGKYGELLKKAEEDYYSEGLSIPHRKRKIKYLRPYYEEMYDLMGNIVTEDFPELLEEISSVVLIEGLRVFMVKDKDTNRKE